MKKKLLFKISAGISLFSGLIIILGVILPIIKYEIEARQKYPVLLSPIGISRKVLGVETRDSSRVGNWFNSDINANLAASQGGSYYLSIPRLKIDNALVKIGDESLSKSLIQLPGTALPGKVGNSVIFGHSVLPIFYSPKNYLTIFSTLPTLKIGDEIDVNYDSVYYRYLVEDLFELTINLILVNQPRLYQN